jgi:hypothetical protein
MTTITLPKTSLAAEDVQAFDYRGSEMEETHPALLAMYDVDMSSAQERTGIWDRHSRSLRMRVADSELRGLHLIYNDRIRLFSDHIYTSRWGCNITLLSHEAHGAAAVAEYGSLSSAPSASETLSRLVVQDAERIWQDMQVGLVEDEMSERVQWQFDAFLERHGDSGVKALSAMILGRLPSAEVSWSLLRMLAEARDNSTLAVRRDVVAASLESRDPGLRYAAAAALGEFEKEFAAAALERRLKWEKNPSVRRMIEAELRR